MLKADDYSFQFYNQHGLEYLKNKRDFYAKTNDTGRLFFRKNIIFNVRKNIMLDMGCGAGDDLIEYKKLGSKKVIGIEPSSTMLEAARKTIKKSQLDIALLAGQWNRIPLADRSVDIITAYYSLHVIPTFGKAFCEAARVLKKDGLFIIGALHPLFDAKMCKEQKLKLGDWMKIPIFDGKFIVEDPPHTIDDYYSKICLDYFKVEEIVEYSMSENKEETEPSGLLLKLRRK